MTVAFSWPVNAKLAWRWPFDRWGGRFGVSAPRRRQPRPRRRRRSVTVRRRCGPAMIPRRPAVWHFDGPPDAKNDAIGRRWRRRLRRLKIFTRNDVRTHCYYCVREKRCRINGEQNKHRDTDRICPPMCVGTDKTKRKRHGVFFSKFFVCIS